jgi:nucleoside-diphosphate-sugar epimerase
MPQTNGFAVKSTDATLPPNPSKKLLIIGCGYVGSRVARTMMTDNWSVFATTRSSQKAVELRNLGIKPVIMDISQNGTDTSTLPASNSVLWAVGFDNSPGRTREAAWVNGVNNVSRQSRITDSPSTFCLISSVSVYGDRAGQEVDESANPTPGTDSGHACWRMEETARQLLAERQPSARLVTLRLAGIYGPGRLIRRLEDLKSQKPFSGTGKEWLNLIHVDDAVAMIHEAIMRSDCPPVINIVGAEPLTRGEYFRQLSIQTGMPPPVFAGDSPATRGGLHPARQHRGGNKRVVSRHRGFFRYVSQFDDINTGLRNSLQEKGI